MKACYEVEERIRRHNENCKADCVSLVEKNLRKKGLDFRVKTSIFPRFSIIGI